MDKIKKSVEYEGFEVHFKLAGKNFVASNIEKCQWPYGKKAVLKIINGLEEKGIEYKVLADVVTIPDKKAQINYVKTTVVSKRLIEKLKGKYSADSGHIHYHI